MAKDMITFEQACKIMEISKQTYYRWKHQDVAGLPVGKELRPRQGASKMFDRKEVESFRKSNWYSND